MKNRLIQFTFICLLMLFFSLDGYAQSYKEDDRDDVIKELKTESTNEQLNLITTNSTPVITNNFVNRNAVFIEQVGFGNETVIAVASDDSSVNLIQEGNFNRSFIKLSATSIRENVLQRGNGNLFADYSVHGATIHNVDLIQDGNYNTVISAGRNSISENLKINQTGNGAAAYVIHY